MRVHKSNLRAKQLSNAGGAGAGGAGGGAAAVAVPGGAGASAGASAGGASASASASAATGGRVLKSCLKKPVAERDPSTPKKIAQVERPG